MKPLATPQLACSRNPSAFCTRAQGFWRPQIPGRRALRPLPHALPPAPLSRCPTNEPCDALSLRHAQPHQAEGARLWPGRAGCCPGPAAFAAGPVPPKQRHHADLTALHPAQAPVRRKLELEEAPPPAAWCEEGQQAATSCPLPLASGPLPSAAAPAMQRQDSAWSTLTDMGVQEEPAAPATPEQSSASRHPPTAPTAWEAVEAPLGYALQVRLLLRCTQLLPMGLLCAAQRPIHNCRAAQHPPAGGEAKQSTSPPHGTGHMEPLAPTLPLPVRLPAPSTGLAAGASPPAAAGQAGR